MTEPSQGMFGKAKEGMGNMLDKVLGFPDSFSTPGRRKIARIVFDIIFIALGVAVFLMMTQGNFSSLANPSLMTMMSLPMCLAISSIGLSWLIQDIVGKKHERVAGKIAAVLMPILIVGAAGCLMGAGFHHGFTGASINGYLLAGMAIIPLSFFALASAIKVLTTRDVPHIVEGPVPDNGQKTGQKGRYASQQAAKRQVNAELHHQHQRQERFKREALEGVPPNLWVDDNL